MQQTASERSVSVVVMTKLPLAVLLAGLVWSLATLVGCASCAGEGEYCVEEDCCDDLTCTYVESQGYRCK
jgi:hypothetical protein